MRRFIVDSTSADSDSALKDALSWLVAESQMSDGAIYLAGLEQLSHLSAVLSGDQIARLDGERQLDLSGSRIHLILRLRRPMSFAGAVLAPWASPKLIQEVEGLEPSAICVTGWIPGELDEWKRVHGPIDVRGGVPLNPPEKASDAVKGAVDDLTSGIADDVLHPYDRDRAIRAFRALRHMGRPIDYAIVRAEALRKGWGSDSADRLAVIARDIANGKGLHGGKITKAEAKKLVTKYETGATE